MRIFIILMIVLSFMSREVEVKSLRRNKYYNHIIKKCNIYALNKTNFKDVYDCLNTDNKNECSKLSNYAKFNCYRNECFKKTTANNASVDIVVYLIIWIALFLFTKVI